MHGICRDDFDVACHPRLLGGGDVSVESEIRGKADSNAIDISRIYACFDDQVVAVRNDVEHPIAGLDDATDRRDGECDDGARYRCSDHLTLIHIAQHGYAFCQGAEFATDVGELGFCFASQVDVKLRFAHLEFGKTSLNAIDVGQVFALTALYFVELTFDFEGLILRDVALQVQCIGRGHLVAE